MPSEGAHAEAATILLAARKEKGFMRWLPWVLCLTGSRLNELCQSNRADVSIIDGVATIRIHDEETGRTYPSAEGLLAARLRDWEFALVRRPYEHA